MAFFNGTWKVYCRPNQYQRAVYNGRKQHYGLKYQAVSAPGGMVAHMYGLIERKRDDSAMLALSDLVDQLNQFSCH